MLLQLTFPIVKIFIMFQGFKNFRRIVYLKTLAFLQNVSYKKSQNCSMKCIDASRFFSLSTINLCSESSVDVCSDHILCLFSLFLKTYAHNLILMTVFFSTFTHGTRSLLLWFIKVTQLRLICFDADFWLPVLF